MIYLNSLHRFLLVLALCSFAMFSGCTLPGRHNPKTRVVTSAGTSLQTNGAKETPATIENKSGTLSVPLPPQSVVTVSAATATEPEKIVVTVPAATTLSANFASEHIETAKDFAPPAPPTQTELAQGSALKWSLIAGGLFVVLALLLVYAQHYKAAGFAAIGAFVVPAAGNFFTNDKAMLICGVIAAIVFTLFGAWYLVDGKIDGKLSNNKFGASSLPPSVGLDGS